ncbi:hypothetical protein HRI_004450700 [Hibiscus trionum]|uniref:Uncharacterized protein n=1 Tax=Hibiscus trionum TaxID=183268 RepID=A0A9W7J5L5_HIBTR|nr:hypothetical protein HRI_004450700 [Hibiscus trionum]
MHPAHLKGAIKVYPARLKGIEIQEFISRCKMHPARLKGTVNVYPAHLKGTGIREFISRCKIHLARLKGVVKVYPARLKGVVRCTPLVSRVLGFKNSFLDVIGSTLS